MKNLTQTIFILICFLFISTTSFGTEKGITDTTIWVEVDGKVLVSQGDDTKLYNVELLCQDVVVESVEVKDDESFLLKVKKNASYTIRISKEGYHAKNVSVNTKDMQANSTDPSIHINTELISNCVYTTDKAVELAPKPSTTKKRTFVPTIDYNVNISNSMFNIQEINPGYSDATALQNVVAMAD